MALTTYTLAQLEAAAKHATGLTSPDSSFYSSFTHVVWNAINFLCNAWPWTWRQRPMSLSVSATAITSMQRNSGIVTVTKTAHGLGTGDTIRISGSAAAADSFDGTWTVASAPTANTFTFMQAGEDEAATTPGVYYTGHIDLPEDFSQIAVLHRGSDLAEARPTSLDNIVAMRRGAGIVFEHGDIYYAVGHGRQASTTVPPRARLEVFPIPAAESPAWLVGVYIREVSKPATSTDVPDIPAAYHPLLWRLVRAMAVSDEHGREGEDWRIFERMLPAFIDMDGGIEDNLGQIQGALQRPAALPDAYFFGRPVRFAE